MGTATSVVMGRAKPVACLRVITVGGIPLELGGKRIGYGVPGVYLIRNGSIVAEAWPWIKEPEPEPVRRAKIDDLGDVRCAKCGRYSAVVSSICREAIAERNWECPTCGTKHLISRSAKESATLSRREIEADDYVVCAHCDRYYYVATIGRTVAPRKAKCPYPHCGQEQIVSRA